MQRVAYFSPEVIDGGTLWADGRFIRLAGIEPLNAEDVCEAGRRRVWRCGLQARVALRSIVRRRRVECTPLGGGADPTLARCTGDGRDLSAFLLGHRLAIPLDAETAQNDEDVPRRGYDPPPYYPTGRRY